MSGALSARERDAGVVVMRHPSFQLSSTLSRARVSPSGLFAVAGASGGAVFCWSLATGAFECELGGAGGTGGAGGAAPAPRRKPAAHAERESLEDDDLFAGSFAELSASPAPGRSGGAGAGAEGPGIIALDYSPTGDYIATGDTRGTLSIWSS